MLHQSILGLVVVISEEEASHVIAVEGIHRLGECLFLEVGMSTTGSLSLTKRGVLHRPSS